jgi:hypothetical protein
MRAAGIILTILGLIGSVVFGIQAMNESESFSVFGAEVAVSKADWTPLIISGVVLLVGIIILAARKKS